MSPAKVDGMSLACFPCGFLPTLKRWSRGKSSRLGSSTICPTDEVADDPTDQRRGVVLDTPQEKEGEALPGTWKDEDASSLPLEEQPTNPSKTALVRRECKSKQRVLQNKMTTITESLASSSRDDGGTRQGPSQQPRRLQPIQLTRNVGPGKSRNGSLKWASSDGCTFLRDALLELRPLERLTVGHGCLALERVATEDDKFLQGSGLSQSQYAELCACAEHSLIRLVDTFREHQRSAKKNVQRDGAFFRKTLRELLVLLCAGGEVIREEMFELGLVRMVGIALCRDSYSLGTQRLKQHGVPSPEGSVPFDSSGAPEDSGDRTSNGHVEQSSTRAVDGMVSTVVRDMPEFEPGDRVDGLCDLRNGKQRWFGGVILGVRVEQEETRYHVRFDDGDENERMETQNLRPSKRRNKGRIPGSAGEEATARSNGSTRKLARHSSSSVNQESDDSENVPSASQVDHPFKNRQEVHRLTTYDSGILDDITGEEMVMDIPPSVLMKGNDESGHEMRLSLQNLPGPRPVEGSSKSLVPPLDVQLSQRFSSQHFDLGTGLSSTLTFMEDESADVAAVSVCSSRRSAVLDSGANWRPFNEDCDEDCESLLTLLFLLLSMQRVETRDIVGIDERILPVTCGKPDTEIWNGVGAHTVLRKYFGATHVSEKGRAGLERTGEYLRSLSRTFHHLEAVEVLIHLITPVDPDSFGTDAERIACGRFGNVFRLRPSTSCTRGAEHQYIAMKSIPAGKVLQSSSALGDVFREVLVMQRLGKAKDNVFSVAPSFHSCGLCREGSASYCIFMEYCEAGTLASWRHAESFDCNVQQVLRIFAAICKKLARAHELGIAHLDLKTENILLSTSVFQEHSDDEIFDRIRIADWGEAIIVDLRSDGPSRTRSTRVSARARGTQAIQSPEMLMFNADSLSEDGELQTGSPIGVAADVWALGCLIFEMLSGSMLFANMDFAEFFVLLTCDGSGPADVSVALKFRDRIDQDLHFLTERERDFVEDLMKRSLQRDPRSRCSADELGALALTYT